MQKKKKKKKPTVTKKKANKLKIVQFIASITSKIYVLKLKELYQGEWVTLLSNLQDPGSVVAQK